MKRSDTLFRHKAKLLYDTCASIKEMVFAITHKMNSPVIDFSVFEEMGVCERVGTWVWEDVAGKRFGTWGLFTLVQRNFGSEDIYFVAKTDDARREKEMYDCTLDELIYLHDEIEEIYKAVVKGDVLAR